MSYHHNRELLVPVLRRTSQLPLSTRSEQHRRFSGDGKSKIIFAMAAEAAAFARTRPIAAAVGWSEKELFFEIEKSVVLKS